MPFVPTPAAFFRRRAGLLSGAHFLPERGGGGWNPRHSFLQAVLLSAAQFAGQALLYRLLSCTQFRGAGVGIPRTVYGGRGCYRQHNFGAVCIAGQKKWLLSGAQFGLFFRNVPPITTAAKILQFGNCAPDNNPTAGNVRWITTRLGHVWKADEIPKCAADNKSRILPIAQIVLWITTCRPQKKSPNCAMGKIRLLLSAAHFGKNELCRK